MTPRATLLAMAATSAAMIWLMLSLPPHAFYAGDSGVKLIVARNVIAHPARPLVVDLPVLGGQPVPYVERFFAVHDQHAHALQSPVFPILAAPLIAVLGLRGAYLLPLAGFLALPILLNAARARAVPNVHAGWVLVLSTVASPVVFYALEFWEHVPAIALLAGATVLTWPGASSRRAAVASGVASGVAILLRPEAVYYVAVLCWFAWRRHVLVAMVAGLSLPLVPFALANWIESGHVAGPHVAANMAPLSNDWLWTRARRGALWLALGQPTVAVGLAALGVIFVASRRRFDLHRAQVLALLIVAALAVAAAAGAFPRESLWNAWPAAFLLLVPSRASAPSVSLWALVLVPVTAIWLTSAHDGGAQWGPRFVLICAPAGILLVATICADAAAAGPARRVRQALLVTVVLCCVFTSRAAYRELRTTKQIYAQLVETADTHIRPGSYVVTNLWWFDQVAAALHGTRTFLFAPDAGAAAQVLEHVQVAGAPAVSVVWSRDSDEGESLAGIAAGTCYRFVAVQMLEQRALAIGSAVCQRDAK